MKIYIVSGSKDFTILLHNALIDTGQKDITAIVAKTISPKELAEKASDCEILVASPSGFDRISKGHLDSLPKLKFITTTSVGVDWVDVEAVKERGIIISNQKGVNSESVAEHCFGMILDLAKRITEADRGLRERGDFRFSTYSGKEIYGKTLGIIGLGDIGQKLARMARGFSMNIIGINKSKKLIDGVELVNLETLLKTSDVIAVTIPLTSDTENLLAEKEFSLMKSGVILVSISREKIIDKSAVLKAIDSGKVFGFGFETEIMSPIEKDDPYLKKEKVVITPHTASMTKEAEENYGKYTVENVEAFLSGKPIRVVE